MWVIVYCCTRHSGKVKLCIFLWDMYSQHVSSHFPLFSSWLFSFFLACSVTELLAIDCFGVVYFWFKKLFFTERAVGKSSTHTNNTQDILSKDRSRNIFSESASLNGETFTVMMSVCGKPPKTSVSGVRLSCSYLAKRYATHGHFRTRETRSAEDIHA